MATKSRSIRTSTVTKIIAFILAVVSITAALVQTQYSVYQNIKLEPLFVKQYKDSEGFRNDVYNAVKISSEILNGNNINQNIDFYYYISNGKKVYTNVQKPDRNFFAKYDSAFFAFEKGEWSFGKNTNLKTISYYDYNFDKATVYIAYSNEFLQSRQIDWENSKNKLLPIVVNILSAISAALILIIYLICVTGRKPEDMELHLNSFDRIFSDIQICAFIFICRLWLDGVTHMSSGISYESGRLNISQIYSMIETGIITAAVSVVCGFILLSLVRKIKAGKFIKHSLIYLVIYKVSDLIKSLFDGRIFEKYPLTKSLFYRQAVFIISSGMIVILTVLFLFGSPPLAFITFIGELVIIYWYIKENNKTFEQINKGFNESLEEQMKSERMKIALVTNVSHDLKTPLTSIISYVDLLSKEEDLSETAGDYVKILAEKSNRLKNIVSDLFDLAKSTSGDISLELETLDIKKLVEQTLGDMGDEIEKSGLQIKTKLPENSLNVVADGKRLYRVFQNVVDNALKYSLNNTRIIIELEENNNKAVATIKNIANYEMDFTAEEILQRFSRGDKSRTTEGSGLGLSIAQSFTEICGGDFKVDIDGDLFKVTISFNLSNKNSNIL